MNSKKSQDYIAYYQKKIVTDTYDAQREGNAYRVKKRALELKFFLELIDKQPSDDVLELGCSSGFLTKHLGKVIAIDTSEDMLKIAHAKNKLAKCIPGDMFNLQFKDKSFNKITTMRVWVHLNEEDLRRAIKEAKKVLKDRGELIFDIEEKNRLRRFVAFWYQKITRITGFEIHQYSLNEINKILTSEGFKIEDLRYLEHRVGRQIILRARLNEPKKKVK